MRTCSNELLTHESKWRESFLVLCYIGFHFYVSRLTTLAQITTECTYTYVVSTQMSSA